MISFYRPVIPLILSLLIVGCPAQETESGSVSTESSPMTEAVASAEVSGDIELGKQVFLSKTCTTCHAISSLEGAVGTIGPALDNLGTTAAARQPGKDALTYIRESIEDPNAYLTEGYPAAMPPLRATMSDEEYQHLLAYLISL